MIYSPRVIARMLALREFVENAKPGDTIVYVRGDIAYALEMGQPHAGNKKRKARDRAPWWGDLLAVANFARQQFEAGKVYLTQRRLGDHDYEYGMTRAGPRRKRQEVYTWHSDARDLKFKKPKAMAA
jgi:hypothetical protein